MKNLRFFAAVIFFAVAAPQHAQEAIESAFNRLTSDRNVVTSHSISYDGSPEAAARGSGRLCSMLEVYNFKTKSKNKKLVDAIVQAMFAEKNNPACYRIESYSASALQKPRAWDLLYGEEAQNKVEIGRNQAYNYAFVNIADRAPSAQGQYRTCYCIEWREWLGKIDGRLIVTYARIPTLAQTVPTIQYHGSLLPKMDEADYEMIVDTVVLPDKWDFHKNMPQSVENLRSEELLVLINALQQALVEADYAERNTIAPILYRVIKHAVANHALNKDERELVQRQLMRLVPSTSVSDPNQSYGDYLRLAVKILGTAKTP